MPAMWRVAYSLVLVASLAANGYLIATASTEASPPRKMREARARAPRTVERPASKPRPSATVDPAVKDVERTTLERRLADAEFKLDKLLPLDEKFDASPRSAEAELRARKIFDEVLGPGAYTVECHDVVCKLDTEISPNEWQLTLFRHAPGSFEGMQLGATSYLRLKEAGEAAGINYVVDLMYELQESPQTAACKEANPTKGVVTLALVLDASTRRVRVEAGGPLGNSSGGVCIRKVLEDLVAQTPLPPEATALVEEPFPFWVP
jgi:hypothetical protein